MPVTSGKYKNNESQIYKLLTDSGLNTAAACGILANLEVEAGFNPTNLQNTYENKLGYSDSSYTKAVDNGTYSKDKFSNDSAGYGICQWTYKTRKRGLHEFATLVKKTSIGDLSMQVDYLLRELKSSYSTLWDRLLKESNTASGAYDAAYHFCKDFERPAGGSTSWESRGRKAQTEYWTYYSGNPSATSNLVPNLGQKIVLAAREVLGNKYKMNGIGSEENIKDKTFDAAGIIYYSYNTGGYEIPDQTAGAYYSSYKEAGKVILSINHVSAADLLFYFDEDGNDVESIALANGDGGRIRTTYEVIEEEGLGNPDLILRILSDSETSQGAIPLFTPTEGLDPLAYASLTTYDPNAMIMQNNLSRMTSSGYDYGYLIDMTHGGEFKFYVPEFTEQAGANWKPIDIRGRSVAIQSYESTNSRSITVSLDLYAGEGLYRAKSGESGEDTVSRLHKDAYFVKSLEYPDYSNAIIRPPSVVHLILGSSIDITGVVQNVTVEHLKPLDSQNRSLYLKLSFTVLQTAVNPIDYKDVRQGQYTLIDTVDPASLGLPANTNAPVYAKED